MVKAFTPNKNGKIEFTTEELEKLLNEAWYDGYNTTHTYIWSSPYATPWWNGVTCTTSTISTTDNDNTSPDVYKIVVGDNK